MKLAKAIEILQPLSTYITNCYEPETKPAIKLGIEAMKWRQHCEDVGYVETCDSLPGED